MMKRIFLALALVAAVAGCGGDKVVQFGAVLPLTGEFELYGQSVRKGIELALEQLQADPEFPQVEVTTVDSESNPEKAQELLSDLYSQGAVAAIGAIVTAEALQMVAVADRYDRILVSPSASSPELTGISKNFYRVFPSDSREGTTMGNFASGKLQLGEVMILSKEDPYARGIQEVFKNEFERNGGTVAELIEFPPVAADLTGLVARVMTVDPAGVYVAAYAPDVAEIIQQLRAEGYEGTILTTSAFASPEVIERVGAPAEGVFLTQAVFEVESEDPQIQEFVGAYREKFGLSPDLYSAHGYDSLMVLAEVYQLAEGIPSDFWKGIRKLSDFVGVTGTIQFDEKGDVQKFPRVYVVEGGNLVDYEKEVERRRRELLDKLRRIEERQRRQLENNG